MNTTTQSGTLRSPPKNLEIISFRLYLFVQMLAMTMSMISSDMLLHATRVFTEDTLASSWGVSRMMLKRCMLNYSAS